MLIPNPTTKIDPDTRAHGERTTVELCGEQDGSYRCILARDHEGHHECHTATTVHSWHR